MKRILIMCSNMNVGGVQKSLLSLLTYIDYTQYHVDLLLFSQSGMFMNKIPDKVNVISPIIDEDYFLPAGQAILKLLHRGHMMLAFKRLLSAIVGLFDKGEMAYILSRALPDLPGYYDAAIDYGGQWILYFMVDKVCAEKKISYFHNDYKKWNYYENMDRKYYKYVDNIVTVSEECVASMKEVFPEYKDKIICIENIITDKTIQMYETTEVQNSFGNDDIKLVTVGRVGKDKGFDFAINTLEMLIKNGYAVKWYFVGPVVDKKFVKEVWDKCSVKQYLVMTGATDNPYQYMREADIYVHPSRFEGKAVAVEEAKVLHIPVVLTNYSTAKDQIIPECTGMIANMDPVSIYDAVVRLIEDKELYEKIVKYEKENCNGNEEEIEKFYAML